MINHHEKFNIIDVNKRNTGVFLEVNWEPQNDETNNCKVLKMTLPDGKEYFIEKEILLGVLWVIGTREDQQKIIPQRIQNVRWYETVLGITATRNIKKGEKINIPLKLTLPVKEHEAITDIRRPSGGNNLILPQNHPEVPKK